MPSHDRVWRFVGAIAAAGFVSITPASARAQPVQKPASPALAEQPAPAVPPAAPPVDHDQSEERIKLLEDGLKALRAQAAAAEDKALKAAADGQDAERSRPSKPKWYDSLSVSAFVDAYVSVNFALPRPEKPTEAGGGNSFRAYDVNNGVSLHWVGLDVAYAPDPVGATLNLRFGPSATIYGGADNEAGLENIKQGYLTLRPGGANGKFSLDFGKFDTFIGSEVADSQYNIDYTRGVVYWYAQPLFHTGFRAEYDFAKAFAVKAIVVNGWNDTIDDNAGKTGGLQLTITPVERLILNLGYLVGPEQADTTTLRCGDDTRFSKGRCVASLGTPASDAHTVAVAGANRRLKHLGDLIVEAHPTDKLKLLANADLGAEQLSSGPTHYAVWAGGSLAARYAFVDAFALGVRGEIYHDSDGYTTGTPRETYLYTGTLTANLTPFRYLSVFLDARIDGANGPFFYRDVDDSASLQGTLTLGAIARTQ